MTLPGHHAELLTITAAGSLLGMLVFLKSGEEWFSSLSPDFAATYRYEELRTRLCECMATTVNTVLARVEIVTNVTPEFVRSLREDPTRLRHLTAEQFEVFAAERMDKMGFAVTLTGATNRKDGGVDIIGAKRDPAVGDFLIAAQVKHHRGDQRTGIGPVDRILSLKNSIFTFGLVVTNTAFTQDARWKAAQGDNRWFARLRDLEDIKRWLEDNFAGDSDYTDLPSEIELAPGVRITIPRPGPTILRSD